MGGKLILYHGLPGSGKSTHSEQYIREHPNEKVVILNRDSIREALFSASYHSSAPDPKSEAKVTAVQKEMFNRAVKEGATIIDDNTNLNPRFLRRTMDDAKARGLEIEQVYFDIPVEEAQRRNEKRRDEGGRYVPPEVIQQMSNRAYDEGGHLKRFIYSKHGISSISLHSHGAEKFREYNERLAQENPMRGKAVVILDCDGTLVNNAHLSKYYLNNKAHRGKRFDEFYRSIKDGEVNGKVRDLANAMRDNDNLNIVLVTGRDDDHPEELIGFLERSGVNLSRVIPKYHGDQRPDYEFKASVIRELREEGLIPVHAIDDRDNSVKAFEDEGIMVSRVIPPTITLTPGATDPPPAGAEPEINTVYGSGYCIRCGSKLKAGNIGKRCAQKANI